MQSPYAVDRIGLPNSGGSVCAPAAHFQVSLSRASLKASFFSVKSPFCGTVGRLHPKAGAAPLTQAPAWQLSPSVQILPSSHGVPSSTAVPTQTPAWQTSEAVHGLSSLHAGPVSAVPVQAPA